MQLRGITERLFFSILAAAVVAILSMFFIVEWSINRGFLSYLETLGQGRLEEMVQTLGQAYGEHRSWEFLKGDRKYWTDHLMGLRWDNPFPGGAPSAHPVGDHHPPPPPPRSDWDRPPPPPPEHHRPSLPFVVLDREKLPVLGTLTDIRRIGFMKPVMSGGETVGYVALLSPKHFLAPPQLHFLRQQKSILITAGLGVVLVVIIFSFPLARRLVRPIRVLAGATGEIASGTYSVRVPVTSSDELGDLARSFNAMAQTLEQNETARRQWIADISHELRTPLSVLRGELEALIDGVRPLTSDSVTSLHAETLRLNRLVDDLYQLALSDLGSVTYQKRSVALSPLLSASVAARSADFADRGITLSADIPNDREITVFADSSRLEQLFTNLLDNALKYTDPGGHLIVRLTRDGTMASITFEDSPPGVPESAVDRLFDRLYRVEESRNRSTGGSGLGLALCRNIAEAHNGRISAHRSSLGGLAVVLLIPIEKESL